MDSPLLWAFGRVFNRGASALQRQVLVARRVIEERASAVGKMVFLATGGSVVRSSVKFETLAREGYESNPVVFRCTKLIADALKSMPILVQENGKDVTDTHPLAAVLQSPNPDMIWEELVEAMVGHITLAGEIFLEGVTVGEGSSKLQEIYALRPDRMSIDPSEDGSPKAYVYEQNGGSRRFDIDVNPLKFRPVLQIKNWHPRDHWRGLPMLAPAATAGDEHNQAVGYAKALYQNSARPSGALVFQPKEGPATLSEDAFDRLKSELAEHHQGAANAGKPMLLDGGLSWAPMGLSPKDMEAGAGRAAAAREIAFALGVPPLMLGLPGDNTFSNYKEAKLAFWQNTVWPLATLLQKKLTAWVRPLYPNVRIVLDQNETPIAEAEKEIKWERVRQADFLTIDEKREATNYEPLPSGQGTTILVASSLMPLDQVLAGADPSVDPHGLNDSNITPGVKPALN